MYFRMYECKMQLYIYLFIHLFIIAIFVEPVCGERYIVVTTSVRCMCVCASGFCPDHYFNIYECIAK